MKEAECVQLIDDFTTCYFDDLDFEKSVPDSLEFKDISRENLSQLSTNKEQDVTSRTPFERSFSTDPHEHIAIFELRGVALKPESHHFLQSMAIDQCSSAPGREQVYLDFPEQDFVVALACTNFVQQPGPNQDLFHAYTDAFLCLKEHCSDLNATGGVAVICSAMACVPGKHHHRNLVICGSGNLRSADEIIDRFYCAFKGAKLVAQAMNVECVVHTFDWVCSAFDENHMGDMFALQAVAASMAGVDRLVLHDRHTTAVLFKGIYKHLWQFKDQNPKDILDSHYWKFQPTPPPKAASAPPVTPQLHSSGKAISTVSTGQSLPVPPKRPSKAGADLLNLKRTHDTFLRGKPLFSRTQIVTQASSAAKRTVAELCGRLYGERREKLAVYTSEVYRISMLTGLNAVCLQLPVGDVRIVREDTEYTYLDCGNPNEWFVSFCDPPSAQPVAERFSHEDVMRLELYDYGLIAQEREQTYQPAPNDTTAFLTTNVHRFCIVSRTIDSAEQPSKAVRGVDPTRHRVNVVALSAPPTVTDKYNSFLVKDMLTRACIGICAAAQLAPDLVLHTGNWGAENHNPSTVFVLQYLACSLAGTKNNDSIVGADGLFLCFRVKDVALLRSAETE
eukprot:TRINITY_DN2011_c1_g1_i7.p1 TRINITY_DN2011_c1_g1~~TRINITY_DN2011_c1_g1_i7.p1  ORF type:complete len:619 (+),score=115.75 TRINITY_DN2011_c1_g1_i7:1640-3496(+)